jgi:hypothetical protein
MALFIVAVSSNASATGWPVFPDSTYHRIGNSYGQYQSYDEYGIPPFMHTGIDIMVPESTAVYAIKSGYVKSILTTGYDTHWRVVVGDSSGFHECEAYMYAHVDSASMFEEAGLLVSQWVEEGQFLGRVKHFSGTDTIVLFDHLHFSRIRSYGLNWDYFGTWEYVGNPLDDIDSLYDPEPPVFENAYGEQLLAFCEDETDSYFEEGEPISGDVDIISRVYDRYNHPDWKLTPYRIEYRIEGEAPIDWTNSVCFTFEEGPYGSEVQNAVGVIYQNDSVCDSRADYNYRWYFINVTNTDGDSLLESSDAAHSWETANGQNGVYRVHVRAHDRAGNSTVDSMDITVENYFTLSGTVTLEGGSDFSGAVVTSDSSGNADTTDTGGDFSVANVGGGMQAINIRKTGYVTKDTLLLMNKNQQLDVTLDFWFVCGNADGAGTADIDDVVFLINYIFAEGPPPDPIESGDPDCSGGVDIDDAVYLIAYIFSGGPEPCNLCK